MPSSLQRGAPGSSLSVSRVQAALWSHAASGAGVALLSPTFVCLTDGASQPFQPLQLQQLYINDVFRRVSYIPAYTEGICSVNTLPQSSARFGTPSNTPPNVPVWLATNLLPVPDTLVSSVIQPKIPRDTGIYRAEHTLAVYLRILCVIQLISNIPNPLVGFVSGLHVYDGVYHTHPWADFPWLISPQLKWCRCRQGRRRKHLA